MSKERKPKSSGRWDQYVKEASKAPFVLDVDDDTSIVIEAFTGNQAIAAQDMAESGTVAEQIEVICGDAAPDILKLIGPAPAGAMNSLVTDIMEHFGMSSGEDDSPT